VKSRTWYEGGLSDFVGLVGRADSCDLGALGATIARSATAEFPPGHMPAATMLVNPPSPATLTAANF
jgi:hypothetical protein